MLELLLGFIVLIAIGTAFAALNGFLLRRRKGKDGKWTNGNITFDNRYSKDRDGWPY
jgi:hypothetical protein